MSFKIVRDFIFALDDKDFLSILDDSSFYNRRVTMKRFYYNNLFGTIKKFVSLRNKSEHYKLASVLKKLIIVRLASVTKASFIRFFSTKAFHTKRDEIIDKFRVLANSFHNAYDKEEAHKYVSTNFEELSYWMNSNIRVFKSVIKLFSKKNTANGDSALPLHMPDLRSKLPNKFGGRRFQYVPARNAIYVNPDQSESEVKQSFVCSFFDFLFSSLDIDRSLYPAAVNRFLRRVNLEEIPDDELVEDVVNTFEDETIQTPDVTDAEMNFESSSEHDIEDVYEHQQGLIDPMQEDEDIENRALSSMLRDSDFESSPSAS